MSSLPRPRPSRRHLLGASALATAITALAACSGSSESSGSAEDDAASDGGGSDAGGSTGSWPRTVTNADDTTTEIPARPERVLSTAVSVTGTLLAIGAPVVASGASTGGAFMDQWAAEAEAQGVESLWEVGSFDLETVMSYEPDLIVVATSGRDALLDQVADLQSVAPTIVVDYGGQTWQELAVQLGEATGLEDAADARVAAFDELVAEAAGEITVPEGTAAIVSYNGAGQDNPIAREGGAQSQLLISLGFTIEDPDPSWHTQTQEREDFVWAPYEKLTELTSETVFILAADDEAAQAFAEDPVLANVPAVEAGQVYGLGPNSFRMDPYSSTEIVEHVRELFAS